MCVLPVFAEKQSCTAMLVVLLYLSKEDCIMKE